MLLLLLTKVELRSEEDKVMKLQTYEISFFVGQSYLNNNGYFT